MRKNTEATVLTRKALAAMSFEQLFDAGIISWDETDTPTFD